MDGKKSFSNSNGPCGHNGPLGIGRHDWHCACHWCVQGVHA